MNPRSWRGQPAALRAVVAERLELAGEGRVSAAALRVLRRHLDSSHCIDRQRLHVKEFLITTAAATDQNARDQTA
jgi:hypothetical protein